jgi:hypothetical protein
VPVMMSLFESDAASINIGHGDSYFLITERIGKLLRCTRLGCLFVCLGSWAHHLANTLVHPQ